MKKILTALMAVMLLICGSALAGKGDRTILDLSQDFYNSDNLQDVIATGGKVYLFFYGMSQKLQAYDLKTGEMTDYDMQEMTDRMYGIPDTAATDDNTGTQQDAEGTAENRTESVQCWFEKDGEIYALVNRSISRGEESTLDGGHVRRLKLTEGKADLEEEDAYTLDWSGMTERIGSWENSRYVSRAAAGGNMLYLNTSDEAGNPALVIFDLSTGSMTEQMIQGLSDLDVMTDGRLIISQYNWSDHSSQVYGIYDPASESLEPLVQIDLDEGGPVSSLVYREDTDVIYFVRNGELFAAPGRDLSQAQAVNDCIIGGRDLAEMTDDGQILIWNYNGALLRNTDPALRSTTAIRIRPFNWSRSLESACGAFSDEHSDIALIREDYGNEDTLLQAMMNRDSSVDVYLISLDSSVFNAVFERGFTADLSGDAKLAEQVGQMYPLVRETLSRDGRLAAIPLSVAGDATGYNPEALEKLGMQESDLPKTWDEYFAFLQELPQRLAGTEIRPFEAYATRETLKLAFLQQIISQYTLARKDSALNTEELRRLLDKICAVDYEALGVMTEEEMNQAAEEGRPGESDGEKTALLTSYSDITLTPWQSSIPLALALQEGEAPILPVSLTVAFVNPWSEHQPEAMIFLESLLNHLDTESAYGLNPNLTEPVRFPDYEEQRKEIEKWLKIARESEEKAESDEEKAVWAENIGNYEKMLKDYDESYWIISPKALEKYRERVQYLSPVTWNYYNALNSAEGGEEFWNLQQGFQQGSTSSAELLAFMDKKLQMMRLEGN